VLEAAAACLREARALAASLFACPGAMRIIMIRVETTARAKRSLLHVALAAATLRCYMHRALTSFMRRLMTTRARKARCSFNRVHVRGDSRQIRDYSF
jgi:chloramphenicol 3-O-phosphotransferase